MKRIVSILLFLAAVSSGFAYANTQTPDSLAQTSGSKHFFEMGAGFSIVSSFMKNFKPDYYYGPGCYFEYRAREMDNGYFGAQLSYSFLNSKRFETFGGIELLEAKCHQIGLKCVGEIEFCPDRKANPFLGVSAGMGYMRLIISDGTFNNLLFPSFGLNGGVTLGHFRIKLDLEVYNMGKYRVRIGTTKSLAAMASLDLGYIF